MPLDPRARRLLGMMSLTGGAAPRLDITSRRQGFAKLMQMGARRIEIATVRDVSIEGLSGALPLRLYDVVPKREPGAPALVFFHGGGLVAGSLDTHDAICRHLALHFPGPVISVGYRLAPEAPWPAALDDAQAAFDAVAALEDTLNFDRQRLAVGGESAGCLLATAVSQGLRETRVRPRAQLLLCPVIDLAGDYPSRRDFGNGYLVDRATLAHDIGHCFPGGAQPPSPLRDGDVAMSPPTVIVAAECDPFRDEAAHFAALLNARSVPVRHTCHPGMVHSFYGLAALLPQAVPALGQAAEELAAFMA